MKISLKKRKWRIGISIVSIIVLILLGIYIKNNQIKSKKVVNYPVSWGYCYGSVKEMYQQSNLVAVVKITDNGTSKAGTLYETIYKASVIKKIKGTLKSNSIKIFMTGGENDTTIYQIPEDPLMEKGDEFLIFAKKNTDNTYTTLGGGQGRMKYNHWKKTVTSLNETTKENKNQTTETQISIKDEKISDLLSWTKP